MKMEILEVNNQPAVKIFAKRITATRQAILFNCEGDQVWIPKSSVRVINDRTILVEERMYKLKFGQ